MPAAPGRTQQPLHGSTVHALLCASAGKVEPAGHGGHEMGTENPGRGVTERDGSAARRNWSGAQPLRWRSVHVPPLPSELSFGLLVLGPVGLVGSKPVTEHQMPALVLPIRRPDVDMNVARRRPQHPVARFPDP